ncbi:MAG: Gfo/Idh/MocA family oxidoreductase [Planctomycetales bacterium]|nr:Gfo/Idh/MocA family oxidoreductase [Planctomycetales bacterium]
MISGTTIRFGMVGAGAIAQAYAQAFQRTKSATLVAVADVRREVADAIADSLHCESYGCHLEMIDRERLDAVVVVTPPATHPEICESLMRRGIHVLCEKPLAIDGVSARRMAATAEQCQVLFTMASKFRYVEDVIRAKSMIASGLLGEIILFENTFTGRVEMKGRWNSDPLISGGGVLIDNGTHSVDILRYFLGPLGELQAVEGKRIQDLEVEDTVRLFARTRTGVMASIDLSWSLHKPQPEFISIYGTRGVIHVGWQSSRFKRITDDEWQTFGNGYDKHAAFTAQLENFAAAIQGEQELLITPQDAIASVEVIEVAYEALWRSRWVPIPSADTDVSSDAAMNKESS